MDCRGNLPLMPLVGSFSDEVAPDIDTLLDMILLNHDIMQQFVLSSLGSAKVLMDYIK